MRLNEKYGDKKLVGLYSNNKIIYDKKTRNLSSENNDGIIIFHRDVARSILKDFF